ncbi:MAG: hypothetical protein HY547_02510 [Elusimicrobia bacterium]|nr:hypothetical protein [Elusimicrobiota bacterium]
MELGTWNSLYAEGATGAIGEFVIRGESQVLLDSDKPALAATFNEMEPLKPALKTLDESQSVDMPSNQPLDGILPEAMRSPFVIVPKRFEFRPDVVAHRFELESELKRVYQERNSGDAADRARWEFRVADATGWVYMQFSGKGLPPQTLDLPTSNQDGQIIRPGSPYTGVLTYRDTEGDVHTAITDSFAVSGLVEKNVNSYHLHLALKPMFEKTPEALPASGPQEKLSAEGAMLIEEAADWIKARQAHLAPLKILVYAKSGDRADQYAVSISSEIRRLLMRSNESIQAKGVASESALDERIEIAVHLSKDQIKNK